MSAQDAWKQKREYDIQMPDAFYEMTPEQIKFACELDARATKVWGPPQWDGMSEAQQRWQHRKAYWTLMGAEDPGYAAAVHDAADMKPDPEWEAECARVWKAPPLPRSYAELVDWLVPKAKPQINLILLRCPQVALLHALRGDVSEPFWWAGLSITEHAEPNLSKECSDGYPGFSLSELKYRQERIKREGTKPALCTRMDAVNAGVCGACRFRGAINSPIALGFDNEPRKMRA